MNDFQRRTNLGPGALPVPFSNISQSVCGAHRPTLYFHRQISYPGVWMSRLETKPALLLRPYVHSYWSIVRDLSAAGGFTVTPDCFLELIFFDDPPWVEEATGRRQLSECTLISLLSEPLHLVTSGVVRCASVRLHAWAAGIVFPHTNTSSQAWFDVTASFMAETPLVIEALRRGAWEQITALFDTALLRAFSGKQPTPSALAAARAFVSPPDGDTTCAGMVAAQQGRSRRHVERQVRSLTDRSPKQLACLTRFQFVRDTLWARPGTELAALAFEAGYADQAHLTRHFRRYAACTPGQFIRDCGQLKTLLGTQAVAFVQDGGKEGDYPADT